jgi:hypothetical protein
VADGHVDEMLQDLVVPGSELDRLMALQRRVDDCVATLEQLDGSHEGESAIAVAEALADKAQALVDLGRLRDAVRAFDDLGKWQRAERAKTRALGASLTCWRPRWSRERLRVCRASVSPAAE